MRCRAILVAALAVPVLGLVAMLGGAGMQPAQRGEPNRFARTQMYIEFNATAGDLGVQVSMDGDPWRSLRVTRPDGKLIMEIQGRKSLGLQGFTELFFESSEPPLAELPLPVFFARFPAGEYKFKGVTIDGGKIEGTAIFTHAIPDKPLVLTPQQGSVQDPGSTVVSWNPVANPPGSQIVAYQVTVTQILEVLPQRVFSVHVPADTLSVTVPPEFLQVNAQYEFEVLAIEAGGNQTIHAGAFSTIP